MYVKLIGNLDMPKTRKAIKSQLKGLNNLTFNITPNVNTKGVQSATKQAINNAQRVANSNKVHLNFDTSKQQLINMIKIVGKNNNKLFNNHEMTAKYNQLLNSANVAKSTGELKTLRGELSAFKTELVATNNAGMTWGSKFKESIKSYAKFFSGASMIYALSNQVRNAATEAKTLDDSLVNLQKVTDEIGDRDALYNYFDKSLSKAQELNVKVGSLIDAVTEFKKLGWDLDDAELGAKWADILSNVGGVDIDTAIGSIKTSIASFDEIGGYGNDQMDKKLEAYTDLINNMSNKYSIDADGLAESIRLSAGTLTEAHMSIEQAATMFATANKYYNDPSYLGNTAKIGSLRMRASSGDTDAIEELQEMGEEVDDLATATSNLREKLMALTGVDIMEDEHTFKSYYDQLYEISQVMDKLDDTSRANVLETMFGKSRSAAGAAILSGMKESASAYEDAINSAGSATEEYQTWMTSADAACQRFSNTLTETYQGIINGNTVRDLANLGSAVLEFANNWGIVEGTLKGVIALGIGKFLTTGTMALVTATKQVEQYGKALQMASNVPNGNLSARFQALKSIAQATSTLTTEQLRNVLATNTLTQADRVRILQMQGMTKEMALQKLAEMNLTQATNAQTAANTASTASTFSLKAAMIGLGATLKSVFLSNPVGIVLMGISLGVSAITSAVSKHNQAVEEARQKAKEAADNANTLGDEIAELANKYIQLSNAVKTDASAKEDLMTTQTELLKKLGLEGESIDDLIAKYGSLSNAIKQASIDSLKNQQTDLIAGVNAAKEELMDVAKDNFWGTNNIISASGEEAVKAFKELEKAGVIDSGSYGTGGGQLVLIGDDTIEGALENYKKLEDAVNALRDSEAFTADELSDNSLFNSIYSRYSEMKESVEAYNSSIDNLNENLAQQTMLTALQGNELPKTEEDFNKFKQELIDTAVASKQFIGNEKEITDAINNYLSTVPEFEGYYSIPLENELDKVDELLNQEDFSKTFAEAWKLLSSDTKKSLTDLAEAGQLTEKAFNKVANTDALTKTGLSVQDLINKINALVDSSKQLSAMRTGIKAITSAYDEKKESKKNVVSSATLSSLSDTLGVSDWSKSDKKVWENYKKTAGDGKKSLSELKKAQDDLATSYVNSNNFLSNLDNTNKGYYISLLQEMGVTNAETVVTQTLANKKYNLALQNEFVKDKSVSLKKATISEINGFIDEKKYSDKAKNALYKLALQKKLTNGTTLDFNSDIGQIKAFVNALGGQIDALTALQKWKANKHKLQGMPSDIRDMKNQEYLEKAQKEVDAALKKVNTKTDVKTSKGNNSNNNKNSKNSNNSKSKSSTQQIDWIARAIDVLNNKLDLANAKYNNLTSLKGKKNNLAEQIKYTTKLINAEKVALSKYTAQYKAVKLDGKLKTAVKEGRLRGTRKQLIATYGEKTANKIQKYQDLYDKAQTARTAIQTQRKNRTDKRKERLQLNVDDADARSSLADARIENNTSAKAKNVQEEKKYKSTKKSYDYQIKIAKLEKDNVKVATLRAQKEKALLDIRVQEKQNLADENEATYNLNQQLETNAVGYKNKNLYETRSRESLKSQYSYLIEIAKLQGNITEQKRLEAELQEKTQSSYMQEINNIKDDYNNRTSLNESDISTNQSKIEKLQAEGLRVSSDFYATNMAINANKRQTLVEEMSQLQSQMNTLTPYSSDWYSTVQDINTIAQNIDTCDKNTVEWQQAINDLELSKFQLINSQLESTINHLDFLIDMIDEDDMFGKDSGNITDAGITALSLYIDKMNETSESIKNKRAEWSKFQEQVARGTSGYDEKTIQDKNEEYASSLRNLIKTNKEVEDSITSIVENGLNKQKDALDDIISKYKQALDRASELRDYQKDVADQTKNINSIEKRIKALSGNDLSEEARARIQKLTVELNDAKDNLQDTQYARWKTDQENMLDDLSDSFEQSITDALANTDSIIEAVQMLVADNGSTVKTYLESMGFGGDSNIVGTKYASNGAYNSTFSTYDGNYVRYNYDMNGNLLSVDTLDSSGNMISSLQNTNSSTNGSNSTSTLTAPINTATAPTVSNTSSANTSQVSLADTIATWVNKHGREATSSDASRIAKDPVLAYLNDHSNRTKKFMISNNEEYELAKLLSSHDSKLAQAISDSKGINPKNMSDKFKRLIAKALKNAGYANGGVVSGLKGAIRANGDSLIATVNPRESILTEEFTNMLPKAVDIMSNFNTLPSLIPKSILNNRSVSQDIKIGDINVTVDAPNAYDANGITQAIKQSTALQKTLQDTTIGQVSKSFNNKLSI